MLEAFNFWVLSCNFACSFLRCNEMQHDAVGPVSAPREGAVLARSPLYPLLPGALVRLMVTKGARAFAEALLADG